MTDSSLTLPLPVVVVVELQSSCQSTQSSAGRNSSWVPPAHGGYVISSNVASSTGTPSGSRHHGGSLLIPIRTHSSSVCPEDFAVRKPRDFPTDENPDLVVEKRQMWQRILMFCWIVMPQRLPKSASSSALSSLQGSRRSSNPATDQIYQRGYYIPPSFTSSSSGGTGGGSGGGRRRPSVPGSASQQTGWWSDRDRDVVGVMTGSGGGYSRPPPQPKPHHRGRTVCTLAVDHSSAASGARELLCCQGKLPVTVVDWSLTQVRTLWLGPSWLRLGRSVKCRNLHTKIVAVLSTALGMQDSVQLQHIRQMIGMTTWAWIVSNRTLCLSLNTLLLHLLMPPCLWIIC